MSKTRKNLREKICDYCELNTFYKLDYFMNVDHGGSLEKVALLTIHLSHKVDSHN